MSGSHGCRRRNGKPKARFPDEATAREHVHGEMEPYFCGRCAHWHVGHSGNHNKQILKRFARANKRRNKRKR